MTRWRLGLRGRLVVAASALTLATLGVAFALVSRAMNRSQERQLDDALLEAAIEEAADLARSDTPGGAPPVISDRPGPAANDVGALEKYAAMYWPDGRLASATDTFGDDAPALAHIRHPERRCFDMRFGDEQLRAVLVSVPRHPGSQLLMAVPRTDVDADASFLARAMLIVFALAVAWTTLLAWWILGRLTSAHRTIVETTKRVALGDLTARVGAAGGSDDPEELGRNVNEMIDRLALLMRGQQQFIAQAAHELRSPLTTLYGELSLALRRERSPQEYRTAIGEALETTRRLRDLDEDLLSLARLGTEASVAVDPVALRDVVAAAVTAVEGEARKRNTRIELRGANGLVLGRARDLERAVRNLLENAVRHSPEGGAVAVEIRVGAHHVELDVLDQGPGVSAEDRDRVFEPFFRGREVRARAEVGAGLGLTIARDIAKRHGGDVRLVNRSAGAGACFTIVLPRWSPSAALRP